MINGEREAPLHRQFYLWYCGWCVSIGTPAQYFPCGFPVLWPVKWLITLMWMICWKWQSCLAGTERPFVSWMVDDGYQGAGLCINGDRDRAAPVLLPHCCLTDWLSDWLSAQDEDRLPPAELCPPPVWLERGDGWAIQTRFICDLSWTLSSWDKTGTSA